jgi:hypothetical protein
MALNPAAVHRIAGGRGDVGILADCKCVAAVIAFCLALLAAMGSSESNADCVADAVRAIPKVDSPATLYDSFVGFRSCDDGAVSRLFTDAVTGMLALQWSSVSQMQSLAATDPSFKQFILRHIDATVRPENLRRIAFNAQHYCPDRSQSFCADLRQAAEVVLRGADPPTLRTD